MRKSPTKKSRISVGSVGDNASIRNGRTLLNANSLEADRATRLRPLLISVDHSRPIRELLAKGRYTGFNTALAKAPRMRGKGTVAYEARIFHFDRIISSQDAKAKIEAADKRRPWKAAGIEHLLALGAAFPHLQGQFPITALGTGFRNGSVHEVACLHHGDGPKRYVVLRWWGDDWCGDFAFLGVRYAVPPL